MKKTVSFRLDDRIVRDQKIIQIQEELKEKGVKFSDYIKLSIIEKHAYEDRQKKMMETVDAIDSFLKNLYGDQYLQK